jgi:hypothetical protein
MQVQDQHHIQKQRQRLAGLLFFLLPAIAFAQAYGRITDPEGNALAFVSIFPDSPQGAVIVSDIEGKFKSEKAHKLVFRYVGFQTLALDSAYLAQHKNQALRVVLKPDDNTLPEALIRPGENPAEALIRKAIEHRVRNNPERYHAFVCNTYNKLSFDLLPHRAVFDKMMAKQDTAKPNYKKIIDEFKQRELSAEEHHAFFMETVTERRFLAPDQNQEKVLLNRVSGFKDLGLVTLANAVQPFSFYGDYLQLLDKNFVNPISPGSINLYFFNIEDTIYTGTDTVWVISFRPRKGKIFDGLEGVLQLNSYAWALQNVRAHPAKPNGNINIKIEQAYRLVGDTLGGTRDTTLRWFPDQLNFELEIPRYPAPHTGMRVAGRSFMSNVQINGPVRQRDFVPEMPIYMETDAAGNNAQKWAPWQRPAPLSAKEIRSYTWLDSLSKQKNMGWINAAFNYLATGKAYLKHGVSLDLRQLLHFNEFEGTRVGLGLTTAESRPMRLPRRFETGLNVGYGFSDRAFKYGAYVLWRANRFSNTQLRVAWQRDVQEPGALHELTKVDVVSRILYANRMDYSDQISASLSSRLWHGASLRLMVQQERVRPGYTYQYSRPDGVLTDRFRFAETGLFFRYAPFVQARKFLGDEVSIINKVPIFEIAYTRGWKDVLNSGFSYNRLAMALYQSVLVRRLGQLRWRVEAGQVSRDVPLAKLFTLNQSGGASQTWTLFVAPNTFQSLPDTLYAADQFLNLYLSQEMGPVLYQRKRSAPRLTVLQNAAWGRLHRPELHHGLGLAVADKALLETGLQLDHLLRFNYINIAYIGVGGAVFYRWGGLDTGNWRRNWAPRVSVKMSFG